MRGTVSFLAGSAAGGYGTGSDMSTGFTLERSIFSDGHLACQRQCGLRLTALPAAVVRSQLLAPACEWFRADDGPDVRRFAPADPNLHNAALQALALSAS